MAELGVEKVYIEKVSGKSREGRPELEAMMNFVREGDVVVVESISRFARSTKELLNLVEELKEKGVEFISQKETIDTQTPSGKFMLTVFAAMAELEREQILQRQKEGIAAAKEAGKYKGRKPIEVDDDLLKLVAQVLHARENLPLATTALAVVLAHGFATGRGRSDNTLYATLHEGVFAASDLYIDNITRHAVGHKKHHIVHAGEGFALSRDAGDLNVL